MLSHVPHASAVARDCYARLAREFPGVYAHMVDASGELHHARVHGVVRALGLAEGGGAGSMLAHCSAILDHMRRAASPRNEYEDAPHVGVKRERA